MFNIVRLLGNSTKKQSNNNLSVAETSSIEKQELATTTQESLKKQTTAAQQTTEEKDWFVGAIGNSKVHAKIVVSGNKVSGVYYYDQYKTNISVSGDIGNEIKDMKTVSLTEGTKKSGEFYGVFRTPDFIEGYWRGGEDIYPMYLIKEGSGINSSTARRRVKEVLLRVVG